MAKKSLSGGKFVESQPKKTSIGHGRRKRGSFKTKSEKPMRGQGR